MQCITTEYRGRTKNTGPRIIARSTDGELVNVPFDGSLAGVYAHFDAVQVLCQKLGWTGEMISGEMQKGYIFVFTTGFRHTLELLAVSHPKGGSGGSA